MTDHRIHRHPERASSDRAKLDALLDAQRFGVLATVSESGEPWAIPLSFARDGDRLVFHGSVAAGLLGRLAHGTPAVFTVVAWDALVVGAVAADIGVNYRSASIRGVMRRLDDDEKTGALERLVAGFLPGRIEETAAFTRKELQATMALELPVVEGSWLYKERTGPALSGNADPSAWTGIVPLEQTWGDPLPDPGCERPLPESVQWLVRDGRP